MRKLVFVLSLLATINLQAWSCFGFGKSTPQQQQPVATVSVVPHAEMITTSSTGADPFTFVNSAEAGVSANHVIYSNNGRFAAVTTQLDGTITIYSVNCENGSLTLIQTIESVPGLQLAAYSPCDNYAAVASYDETNETAGALVLYKVDCDTGLWTEIQLFDAAPELNNAVMPAYSPDGRFLVVANYGLTGDATDSTISVFRVSQITGKLFFVGQLPHTTGLAPNFITYSPNGRFIATANGDLSFSSVSIFEQDPISGALVETPNSPFLGGGGFNSGLAYSHDGHFLAVANSLNDNVRVSEVNPVTGELLSFPQTVAVTRPVYLAYSHDDQLVAVGSDNNPGTVSIFQVCNGEWTTTPIQTITDLEGPQGVAFHPCDDFAAVSILGDGTLPGSVNSYIVADQPCL